MTCVSGGIHEVLRMEHFSRERFLPGVLYYIRIVEVATGDYYVIELQHFAHFVSAQISDLNQEHVSAFVESDSLHPRLVLNVLLQVEFLFQFDHVVHVEVDAMEALLMLIFWHELTHLESRVFRELLGPVGYQAFVHGGVHFQAIFLYSLRAPGQTQSLFQHSNNCVTSNSSLHRRLKHRIGN